MSCILLLYFHVFSNPVFVFLVYKWKIVELQKEFFERRKLEVASLGIAKLNKSYLYFRRKSKLILNLFVCFHKYAHLCAVI